MAKALGATKSVLVAMKKKTSTSGKPSMIKKSSMNKSYKRSYKKYRGQGR